MEESSNKLNNIISENLKLLEQSKDYKEIKQKLDNHQKLIDIQFNELMRLQKEKNDALNKELVETIKNNMHDNKVNILVKRNKNTLNITLPLIYDEDTYKVYSREIVKKEDINIGLVIDSCFED